jgi:predicted PurR-regulated permease PerM
MERNSVLSIRSSSNPLTKMLTLVGIVVVIAGLYFGRQVLIPLALATVLAFLLQPAVGFFEMARIGRVPAVLVVLTLSFALLGGLGWLVTEQLSQIMDQVPSYETNIHNKIESIRKRGNSGFGKVTATVNDLSKELSAASQDAVNKKSAQNSGNRPIAVQATSAPRGVNDYLRDMIGPLANILEIAAITVVFALFILIKREDVRNRMIRLAGAGQLNIVTQVLDEGSNKLSRFLLLQVSVNAAYGVLFGLGVLLIGIPHAFLWGILACVLRFIPYVGTPIAAGFPIAMALAIFPGWMQVWLVFSLFVVLELTIANVIEPWLYGSHTGVSSLAILVAAVFWGMLWGPVGLILSTPLTVCLILMGRYVPQLDFLEVILGDEPVLSPQAHFYQRLLALDENEAQDIAENFLKDHPVQELYDLVLIPALSLAEQDRHTDALPEGSAKFIQETVREIIVKLDDAPSENSKVDADGAQTISPVTLNGSGLRIICMPSRDEADEITGSMLVQLLRRSGHHAKVLPIGTVSEMLDEVEKEGANFVCVSALPPFATGQAAPLCKRLRERFPSINIVLGLWAYPGGMAKAQQRAGTHCANSLATSLQQVIALIAANSQLEKSSSV